MPGLGEVDGGGDADDAGADHHHIGGWRQRVLALHEVERAGRDHQPINP